MIISKIKFPLRTSVLALLCLSAASLLPGVASAGFEEGVAALDNKDYATAFKEFKLLASQGDATSQYNLALMYAKGQGVSQNANEAVKWYRLAAAQGSGGAQFNIGLMHKSGLGVSQDYKEAVKWFRLAAAQGNADAQNKLGARYAEGLGVFSSRVVAYALYHLSATKDASKENSATENREFLSKSMPLNEINAGKNLARELTKPGSFLKALDAYVKTP